MRDRAVRPSAYTLAEIAELDERTEAHLDGLRIAGDPVWGLFDDEYSWDDAGEIFAAAVIAFGGNRSADVDQVLDRAVDSAEVARGAISALGWLPWKSAAGHLRDLLKASQPMHRRIGIAGIAAHRADPGAELVRMIKDDSLVVRARALRAAGELGRTDVLVNCKDHFDSDDVDCRFWAAWSALNLGDSSAVKPLMEIAQSDGSHAGRAGDLVVRRVDLDVAKDWVYQLAMEPDKRRLAIKLAGVIGDPELVLWLIKCMRFPEFARIAAASFAVFSGVDLERENLVADSDKEFVPGPNDDPEDDNVDVDDDEALPWPDIDRLESWWQVNHSRYTVGVRWMSGAPITDPHLLRVLRFGKQSSRWSAATEAALLVADRVNFNVQAVAGRQLRDLYAGHNSAQVS